MTVFANQITSSGMTRVVQFNTAPIKIPENVKSISILSRIATQLSATVQNAAGTIVADAPVYSDNPFLLQYTTPAATALSTTSLAFGIKPAVFAAPVLVPLATGGILAIATYFYRVVAFSRFGDVLAATEASATTTTATSAVTVTWQPVAGATSYRIYRGTATNAQTGFYQVGSSTFTFTDTGTPLVTGTVPVVQMYAVGVYINVLTQIVPLGASISDTEKFLNITGRDVNACVVVFEA
jgi:hypothetical protein